MGFPVYETKRLLLRPASLDDAGLVLQLFNSPKWLKYIGDRNVPSEEDASDYIRDRMLLQYDTRVMP